MRLLILYSTVVQSQERKLLATTYSYSPTIRFLGKIISLSPMIVAVDWEYNRWYPFYVSGRSLLPLQGRWHHRKELAPEESGRSLVMPEQPVMFLRSILCIYVAWSKARIYAPLILSIFPCLRISVSDTKADSTFDDKCQARDEIALPHVSHPRCPGELLSPQSIAT